METALPYLHMLRQLREAYTEAWSSLCGGRSWWWWCRWWWCYCCWWWWLWRWPWWQLREAYTEAWKSICAGRLWSWWVDETMMNILVNIIMGMIWRWWISGWWWWYDLCSRGVCPRLSKLQPATFLRQFFHPALVCIDDDDADDVDDNDDVDDDDDYDNNFVRPRRK